MQRFTFLLWLLCTTLTVAAQNISRPLMPADTLDKALVGITWDVHQRGPLLVINPQGTPALPSAETGSGAEGANEVNLRALATRFGRQVMPVRSLTVLAPTTMVVLNTRPGKPDPYAGMSRSQKLKLLMASLTPKQWEVLGSAQGLGVGDLSGEQQPLFLSFLPEAFALNSYKMENGIKLSQRDKNVPLSPAQRAEVHIRVNRAVEMYLPQPNGSFGLPPDLQYYALANGTEFFTLANTSLRAAPYGASLRAEVPNRPKPTALAFAASTLNASVSLAETKTLGELVQRIAQATHLELYADGRVATLPVWIRGTSARAGDVLQALCLAVTGTLRQVGPAFVLTSDLEGLGSRHARLSDWAQEAEAQRRNALEAADQVAVPHSQQYIGFAPDDPLAFRTDALQKLTANGPEPGQESLYDVPVAALSPAQQAVIQAYSSHQQQNGEGDRVKVALTNRFAYVVPGIGVVTESDVTASNIGLPAGPAPAPPLPDATIALPAECAARALYVRPENGREAQRYAAAARQHGLNQLWVEVEAGAAGQRLLTETVAAGKENHLAVIAVLRLLQTAGKGAHAEALPQEIRDRNLLDETGSAYAVRRLASSAAQHNVRIQHPFAHAGDWLRPDAPETRAYLQQRLRETASTPGLSGVAMVDTTPPGYRDRGGKADPFASTSSGDFGYTPALRLAFLRHSGYDPMDLIAGMDAAFNADLSLPFFPTQTPAFRVNEENGQLEAQGSRTALQDWAAYRYKVNAELLISLHAFLQTNFPDMPLLLRQSPVTDGWWSGWDKPERVPETQPGVQEATAAQAAQVASPPLLLNIAYTGSLTPKTLLTSAAHFAFWVKRHLQQRKAGWNGVVLDLSALPVNEVTSVLEGLAVAKNP